MSRRPPFALNRHSFMGFAFCGAAAALRAPGLTFAAAARAGVRHYFVDQDETPASPFDSVKVSLDYLKRLRF